MSSRGAVWDLGGRVVLVTGAARGIGAATARLLARRGAKLALAGLEPERLEALAVDLGDGAVWFEADVRDRAALDAAVRGTVERLGGIDVVLANAGIAPIGPLSEIDPDDVERTIEVNLLGVWRTLRAALPHVIERRGYLIPIASLAAALHPMLIAHYAASKAGVEALADGLRMELAPAGVGVGVAYFSVIDTDMVRRSFEHPLMAERESELPAVLNRPLPVHEAAAALVDGIERRARTVVAPRWVGPALMARGVLQPALEAIERRRSSRTSSSVGGPRSSVAGRRLRGRGAGS